MEILKIIIIYCLVSWAISSFGFGYVYSKDHKVADGSFIFGILVSPIWLPFILFISLGEYLAKKVAQKKDKKTKTN